eukprot:c13178_g1_i1.p2 GENE.c13178_g1_i1~~c13178_g1_i1.p2  ORF type:complete len:101 (+),score=9.37 c13178_g1_i1:30-305(+)
MSRVFSGFDQLPRNLLLFAQVYFGMDLLQKHVGAFSRAYGPSMEPTLATSGNLLVVKPFKPSDKLNVGDIVVSTSPIDRSQSICKRVGGLV